MAYTAQHRRISKFSAAAVEAENENGETLQKCDITDSHLRRAHE
jgi:hypothetical protein